MASENLDWISTPKSRIQIVKNEGSEKKASNESSRRCTIWGNSKGQVNERDKETTGDVMVTV